MTEFFHIHAEQIRGFNAVMNLLNIIMILLWTWLFIRQIKLRRGYRFLEKVMEGHIDQVKRSTELLQRHVTPLKVHLVWLIGDRFADEEPMVVGCFHSEAAAYTYINSRLDEELRVQEIDVL